MESVSSKSNHFVYSKKGKNLDSKPGLAGFWSKDFSYKKIKKKIETLSLHKFVSLKIEKNIRSLFRG